MENSKNYEWLENWVLEDNHPCVMAQTVFRMNQVDYHEYTGFGTPQSVQQILRDLEEYLDNYNFSSNNFFTFIAAFPQDTEALSESQFERKLWRQLQLLHDADDRAWDENVSADPENNSFSFSLKGKAFYIVGLHPNSSRLARKTRFPTMTFNLHGQFEKLREMKKFKQVRNRIRERDIALQGSINPVLEDFGNNSEAKQYSGRKIDETWKCPFHHK